MVRGVTRIQFLPAHNSLAEEAIDRVTEDHGEIPYPTLQGNVRFVRVDEDYKKRPSNEELLEALRRLEAPDAKPDGC